MDPLNDFLLHQILRTDDNNCVLNLENNEVEYKINFDWSNRSNQQKCIKELAALSNAGGGYLIYGVDDETGKLEGESNTEDLANISNAFSRQFSPTIQLKGITFMKNGIPLFVLYAEKYQDLPTVCIKEFDGVRDGIILYRYASKSEPIKGVDLISVMQFLQRDTATEKLIDTQQENRRKDLMPYFHWNGGTSSGFQDLTLTFVNKGATANVIGLIPFKEINAYMNSHLDLNLYLETEKRFATRGRYKSHIRTHSEKTYSFRIYFKDKDENLYYQEFNGHAGTVENKHPNPEETALEEMEQFKEEQKE